MAVVTIHEAQAKLAELIHRLGPADEVVITENNEPVARLLPLSQNATRRPRQLGTMRGTVLHVAPDFDAPLDDFKEYTE